MAGRDVTPDQTTYGPQAPHVWAAPEHEETVPVRRSELREFADEVERIVKNPLENASAWTAGLATLGIGALLSVLAIGASDAKGVPMWIYILHWGVVIGAGLAAAFAEWVHVQQKKSSTSRSELLAGRIRECDSRAPSPGDQE
jgi:hypothetical protein